MRLSQLYRRRRQSTIGLCIIAVCCICCTATASEKDAVDPHPLRFVDIGFENASPVWWELVPDGTVKIHLMYDQERCSPNRANGHWLFRLEADPGSNLTLELGPFGNVWNGKLSKPVPESKIAFLSEDGETWRAIRVEPAEEKYWLKMRVQMRGSSLYVARLQPYGISDLEKFKAKVAKHTLVNIEPIGRTVEGRELEVIQVGKSDAAHRVLLRARAHAWEPGGNWVIEGLVEQLLRGDETAQRCLAAYRVDILPMANKDGVARGRTRFNMRGMDLNRKWDKPADPSLAPENYALERWLGEMVAKGQRPDLAIDFHNDASGLLHTSRPEVAPDRLKSYFQDMERFEGLLRQHTWFTEGSTKRTYQNPGTFGEGLLARYEIAACIHELNANWIKGVDDFPKAEHWKQYGRQLADVFRLYFAETD